MKMALAYSTKDRPDFTRRTLPPLLKEAVNFDFYWFDGSDTDEAIGLVDSYVSNPKLTGIRYNVRGGPAATIIFALSYMLSHNEEYDYIGLVENDIMLEDGWFEKTMALFDTPGLNVGSVSSRCFSDRVLVPRDNYAVVSNTGAGMVIFRRQCVEWILKEWHSPFFHNLQQFFKQVTGIGYPLPWYITQNDPDVRFQYVMTHDWAFEVSLLKRGMVSLAPTPTMARNIDNATDKFQDGATKSETSFDWDGFCGRINTQHK